MSLEERSLLALKMPSRVPRDSLESLRSENAHLKKILVQLSAIIAKNAAAQK